MNRIIRILVLALVLPFALSAQNDAKTLFEYPTVPDKLTKTNLRADFMAKHLWDKCDLEKKEITDISAFADAFTDYLSFFILADKNVVKESVDSFVKRVSKNKKNLQTVIGFVDDYIYSPYSQYCSEDLYGFFAEAFSKSKKLDSEVRDAMLNNVKKLQASRIDAVFMDLTLEKGDENATLHSLASQYYVAILNIDGNFDTSLYKLRLNTDIATNTLINSGVVTIVSLYSDKTVKRDGDSENWYKAEVSDMEDKFDMRVVPCVYVLDKDKKIIAKSPGVEQVLEMMAQMSIALNK